MGGNSPTSHEMKDFFNSIYEMQVYPIKYVGGNFTQSNQDGLMSMIDHIFSNSNWIVKYSDSSATFLPEGLSNLTATILNTSEVVIPKMTPFKISSHLLSHPMFHDHLVSIQCTSSSYKGVGGIGDKFQEVKKSLKTLHLTDHSKVEEKVEYQ